MRSKGWASEIEAVLYNVFVSAVNSVPWIGEQISACFTNAQLQQGGDELAHTAAAGPGPLLLGPNNVLDGPAQAQPAGAAENLPDPSNVPDAAAQSQSDTTVLNPQPGTVQAVAAVLNLEHCDLYGLGV